MGNKSILFLLQKVQSQQVITGKQGSGGDRKLSQLWATSQQGVKTHPPLPFTRAPPEEEIYQGIMTFSWSGNNRIDKKNVPVFFPRVLTAKRFKLHPSCTAINPPLCNPANCGKSGMLLGLQLAGFTAKSKFAQKCLQLECRHTMRIMRLKSVGKTFFPHKRQTSCCDAFLGQVAYQMYLLIR